MIADRIVDPGPRAGVWTVDVSDVSATPELRAPPSVDDFRLFREPAGPAAFRLAIGDLAIELAGLPVDAADALEARFAAFSAPPGRDGAGLRLEVLDADREHFLAPPPPSRAELCRVLTTLDGEVFRAVSYRLAWWFDLDAMRGQVAYARTPFEPPARAIENLLRSAVAWLAQRRGGLLVHGASIERDGRVLVFYGPSGAGKSTLSAQSRSGRVISDDLTLLLPAEGGLHAAGSPFRGTYTGGETVTGLFPVAGFYRLRKDARTAVSPGDAAAFADFLGNLPWVVDQLPTRPELFERIRAAVGATPFHYLHFRKDEDFWPAIDVGPIA